MSGKKKAKIDEIDEVYEDARDDNPNNYDSDHSSDDDDDSDHSSSDDDDSYEKPRKYKKISHNIRFDMVSEYKGYARRLGNEHNCYIEYEYKNHTLYILLFICPKGGKPLLNDLLKALEDKGLNVHTVKLTAASLDNDKQIQGKTDDDLYKTYIDMGFTRYGETEFIGTRDNILATYENKNAGIEMPSIQDEYHDFEELLKNFPVKTAGFRSRHKKTTNKTKRRKTKRRRHKKTTKKRRTKRRRQTKKRGKR